MNTLEIDSRGLRRTRTRSMIQIAGLLEKSGLLKTFQIKLGLDLQKDITMKEPIAALFKGLVTLNEMSQSADMVNLQLWTIQGLEMLARSKKE